MTMLGTVLHPSWSNFLLSEGWLSTPVASVHRVDDPPPSMFMASSRPRYLAMAAVSVMVIPSPCPGNLPSITIKYMKPLPSLPMTLLGCLVVLKLFLAKSRVFPSWMSSGPEAMADQYLVLYFSMQHVYIVDYQ